MPTNIATHQSHLLLFWGLLLFVLGLLIGLFIPLLPNPRMGLSAHLEGLMNGILLMVLGLIWPKLVLPKHLLTISFWLMIYACFANITAVSLAAIFNAGKMLPLAAGQVGAAWAELIISVLLVTLSLGILVALVIVLVGYYQHIKKTQFAFENQ
ncbi:hydrogenase [Hydrotalea sandarakina]|jgi:hydroxylaminobenzene mutase|uniref:Hydroxylaminobenzene mutase n=1 Tax=Hydrotalea sandarakina TaxID=1004304 RepID=A0A2W7RXZ7_9BACT|nr:hydrogenase [Hydrotalea sandarakina]PZX60087.1 hydroxylaminobenzene mutase [Hydrotalea sandarakina]